MNGTFRYILGPDDEGRRLDRVLRIAFKDVPLSALHRALRKGKILTNGRKEGAGYRCREGDVVEGFLDYEPGYEPGPAPEGFSAPSSRRPSGDDLSRIILLEAKDLLFLNKPQGTLVHDGEESLEAAAKGYLKAKTMDSVAFSPGPLHRLDRNTSGIVAFSRSIVGARVFSRALREKRIVKTYVALFEGQIAGTQRWQDTLTRQETTRRTFAAQEGEPHEGRRADQPATAIVRPIIARRAFTLATVELETGRTHQIRAQAAIHGHPLSGDVKYGGGRSEKPFYLHAWKLKFLDRLFDDIPDEITAPVPGYFLDIIESVFLIDKKEVYSLMRQSDF